ncbi:MAG: hypothetical protein ACJ76N_25175 [Thermoanaerobaculia bacterium]
MRISRLQALALAGLLGLAGAAAASAAGKPCPEDSSESRAVELAKCNGGFADRQRLARVYRRELGLSAGAAARLAEALAAQQALEQRSDQDDPAFEQEIRRIESEFIILLNQAPDDPRIATEVGFFYNGYWLSRVPAPAMLDLVARSADPVRLAESLTEHGYSRATEEILFAALAVRPEAAELWHRAAQLTYDPAWKIALLEENYRRLPAGEDGRPAGPGAILFAEELLDAQLNAGLAPQAIATFRSLAPDVRSRIEEGTTGRVEAEAAGLPFPDRWRDVRRPLATAYLVTGDLKAAAGLAARMEPAPAAKAKADSEVQAGEIARRLLARWLHPAPEDPFELLTTALAQETDRSGVEALALARLAERERYPAIAGYLLELLAQDRSEPPFEPARGVLPRVRAAAESLRGELEKLRRSLADEARADREAARTGFGPDPAAAVVGRLLRAPTAVRFAARPLPKGFAPIELTPDQISNARKAVARMKLPAGFGLINAGREGDRAAAICVSQDYYPVGEVSSGAYWVLLSSDGGRTWDPPLYTGLRANQPYVARVSRLPLLAEDHFQMEVEIAELDPSKIHFPPVALAPKRTAKGLYLDIPLELLQKDSDGDGLTDLAEERLMTDPASRDTDGDGLEDGVDPLPNVPFRRETPPPASARALAAFLADNWNVDRAAIIEGIPAGPRPLCCVKNRVRTVNEKTLFLIADRGLSSALEPTRRVVVLTAEEAEAAKQKFGPFYPQRLELFVFDRSGRRAYAIWDASWEGGQTLLEEQPDGTWKAEPTTSWIT